MTIETHQLNLGETQLTVLNDGSFTLPAGYFSNVPDSVADGLGETVTIGANVWFIRSGDRRILVDTGSAEALKQMFPSTGQAWQDLKTEEPTDIVLTHMHADHIGGLADPQVFPDAKIHVARVEWEFWTQEGLVDAVPEDRRPMITMIQQVADGFADRVVLHDGVSKLAPGLVLEPLPGHTPGHMGVRVSVGNDTLLIIGDAVISEALQFAHPEISYALDGDAQQAVATRRALFEECAGQNVTIAATHFAFPGTGKVVRDRNGFRFEPE